MTPSGSAVRSDVVRNRAALVLAARELLAADKDVPMYEVARRAGVGQATLYRHFPDRNAIATAVLNEIFEDLEGAIKDHAGRPDALFLLMKTVCELALSDGGLPSLLAAEAAEDHGLACLKSRLLKLIAAPLRDAKAAGVVRPDLTANDVAMMLRMVIQAGDEPAGTLSARRRATLTRRALNLVWNGACAG